jgi:hypothetical protein
LNLYFGQPGHKNHVPALFIHPAVQPIFFEGSHGLQAAKNRGLEVFGSAHVSEINGQAHGEQRKQQEVAHQTSHQAPFPEI